MHKFASWLCCLRSSQYVHTWNAYITDILSTSQVTLLYILASLKLERLTLQSLDWLSTMPWSGSGDIAPCILNLNTRWRWVVKFTPRSLYPLGKRPSYSFNRRLSGLQSWFRHDSEEKNPCPYQEMDPHHPACRIVTILTERPSSSHLATGT
jgi:hypothetical protein